LEEVLNEALLKVEGYHEFVAGAQKKDNLGVTSTAEISHKKNKLF